MKKEIVAVLDIRSYEISFLIGARGVNGTFVFHGSKSEKYEGYSLNGFLDEDSFLSAVRSAVSSVCQNYSGTLKEIYVGVPAAFVKVYTKGHTLSFPSKRKIGETEIDALFQSGLEDLLPSGRFCRQSEMYFSVGDNRKYFNAREVFGVPAAMLKGALCYYFVDEEFAKLLESVLYPLGFETIKILPQSLAEAEYLLPEKMREGYASLLDIGFLSTTVSVVYGNGIVHEESFDLGTAGVLVSLMNEFSVDYAEAEEILRFSDISGGGVPKELTWTGENGREFSVRKINEIIKYELDGICESVDAFFAKYYRERRQSVFSGNPLSLTGEGIGAVRGGAEHISKRLSRMTEVVCPELPYYDKPMYSSRIATLNMALEEQKQHGLFHRIFHMLGGRK